MSCIVCDAKEECFVCQKKVKRNTLSSLKILADVEEAIFSKKSSVKITHPDDFCTYGICMDCVKGLIYDGDE